MIKVNIITVIVLLISVSLISGLLFSFSIAVSPGLKHLADLEYLKAMKSINKEILNTLFFLTFFCPLLFFPLAIYYQHNVSLTCVLLISSFVFYLMVIAITATINVPLNNLLDSFDIYHATGKEISDMRFIFENRWTFWNNIRSILSIGSLMCLVLAPGL